jgi:hypothetical protein
MVQKRAILLSAVLFIFPSANGGLAGEGQSEASKAEPIKRIMQSKTFHLPPKASAFCRQFLKDFTQQKGIEFIEPIASADRYDDPVLQPYVSKCPDLGLREKFECVPGSGDDYRHLPIVERLAALRKICRVYEATANFKVYELPGGKAKQTIAFYYEKPFGPLDKEHTTYDRKVFGNGGYGISNLADCSIPTGRSGFSTHDPYNYDANRPVENYNGLIRYQSRYIFFDLFDLSQGAEPPERRHFRLAVAEYRAEGVRGLCSLSTIKKGDLHSD